VSQTQGRFADMGLNFLSWNWLPLFPIFIVYFISGLAETNRHPFDVVEGESEIVAGFTCRVLGHVVRDVLPRRIREHDPRVDADLDHVPGWLAVAGGLPASIPGWIWLGIKDLRAVVTMFLWVRATFPRYRYDQIMRLGWKIFIPVTLVWLVVVGLWMQTPLNIWK
jgi:NADH-quinone oxidoreductase subunit H